MKWSNSFLFTLKEDPSDAEIPSHKLMVRGGYIRKVAPGIFSYGPLALRAIRKFENIVREELESRGAIEILMPMVQPKELWDETGRWTQMGESLQKMKNRTGAHFCLGATHEEVVTDFVRQQIKSYRDFPFNLYQIQTKFRDEIRPRFGLMRGREFVMKDAYSFDLDFENAQKSYQLMKQAYQAIFDRLGIEYRVVQADTGSIGGNQSEEFHILASSGEDELLVSDQGSFAANVEICPVQKKNIGNLVQTTLLPLETFSTPGVRTIKALAEFMEVGENELVKTMFFSVSEDVNQIKPVALLLRGSDEVNPIKLKNLLGLANPPILLTEKEVHGVTGAWPGSCGPVGLNIPVYLDEAVASMTNYVVGANKDDFHTKNVNHGRDFAVVKVADLRMAKEGDIGPEGGILKSYRGIEVGHIFYLGQKYSKAMKAQFLDSNGKLEPIEMGCYGIGVTRTVQAVIEQCHDKDGIVWPLSIAPFHIHICLLDPEDPSTHQAAEEVYQKLKEQKIDVFMDDRKERPGVKFKDADLLGMPYRLNIGTRGLINGEVEIIERRTKKMIKIPLNKVLDKMKNLLGSE
ncbi:MAG: proline--tRNA ligase [Bdellovibrionales bacterium]|nr:proline--tRNA ligase [Bdellovibrionales bacterium]